MPWSSGSLPVAIDVQTRGDRSGSIERSGPAAPSSRILLKLGRRPSAIRGLMISQSPPSTPMKITFRSGAPVAPPASAVAPFAPSHAAIRYAASEIPARSSAGRTSSTTAPARASGAESPADQRAASISTASRRRSERRPAKSSPNSRWIAPPVPSPMLSLTSSATPVFSPVLDSASYTPSGGNLISTAPAG